MLQPGYGNCASGGALNYRGFPARVEKYGFGASGGRHARAGRVLAATPVLPPEKTTVRASVRSLTIKLRNVSRHNSRLFASGNASVHGFLSSRLFNTCFLIVAPGGRLIPPIVWCRACWDYSTSAGPFPWKMSGSNLWGILECMSTVYWHPHVCKPRVGLHQRSVES